MDFETPLKVGCQLPIRKRMGLLGGKSSALVIGLMLRAILLPLAAVASEPPPLNHISRDLTLFGIEYTFQDQEMVNEPGRMTMTTPHKEEKLRIVVDTYLRELGVDPAAVTRKHDFKGGVSVDVPGDGKHVLNPEPVTIEINTTPKRIDQILEAARPVFTAAQAAELVPYVQPAAERSGMGHIHVGGAAIGESPFYRNPVLLRNLLVYLHQHPAALYGFAEAYDVGDNSNIETYHSPERQDAFRKAISEFDAWYLKARSEGTSTRNALLKLVMFLQQNDKPSINFFHHYRYLNLEHIKALPFERMLVDSVEEFEAKKGKYTVEFRNFRPQKSPEHAVADAEYLLRLMDRLGNPDELIPFREISPDGFQRFFTGSRLASDWDFVRRDLKLAEAGIEAMATEKVREAVEALHSQPIRHASSPDIELFPSFSEKQAKGTLYEVRIKARPGDGIAPEVRIGGRDLALERVRLGSQEYWVGSVDIRALGISLDAMRSSAAFEYSPPGVGSCLRDTLKALDG